MARCGLKGDFNLTSACSRRPLWDSCSTPRKFNEASRSLQPALAQQIARISGRLLCKTNAVQNQFEPR